jgi:hypothetical protein
MSSFLDVLAHEDDSHRVASRKALALANKRVSERIDPFIARGKTSGDLEARLNLIRQDFDAVVKQACEEAGQGDWESIRDTLWKDRTRVEAQTKEASMEHEARKPKMCPYHSEVVDISLAAGDATAGFNAMSGHAWGDNHCQGGFEDKCNFKPQMVTQSYWDDKKEKAEQRKQEREEQRQQEERLQAEQTEETTEEAPEFEAPQMVDEGESLDTADTMESELQEEVGLTQDELMAVASSFRQSAPPFIDHLKQLGQGVGNIDEAATNALNKGVGQVTNYLTGQQPPQGTSGLNPGGVQPPSAAGQPSATTDLTPDSVHQQFAQQFGQPGQSGYQQGAHTQENYAQLARDMNTTPGEIQRNLQGFYQNQQQKGLSDISIGGEQLNPAQMASPTVNMQGVGQLGALQQGSRPSQQPRPGYRDPFGIKGGSTHEAADPQGNNLGPIERVDVDKGGETPIPKMDKRKWTPQNLEQRLKTEHPDSPHPTKEMDVQPDLNEAAEFPNNKGDLKEIGEKTTERQDVTQDHETKPQTNNNGWSGGGGSAVK